MRPVELELEGFSVYSRRVSVDFTGVDFFSLTGPTGSGKSSLIDAMVFALFGRVPRLGGNAVAPAISAGADRARVRLDFEVDGAVYTAVRMAQRTSTGGASVREARLQQGDRVVADGADYVTAAVEELLKLRFDDFTRTVVLPQGEFARFLTATRAERQGLLRNLLGMDVYTRVRELARTRAVVAGERAEGAERTLETLNVATEEEMEAAVARRDALDALADSMEERTRALAALEKEVTAWESETERLDAAIGQLSAVEAPGRLAELDTLMAGARSTMVDATEARETARARLAGCESAVAGLPSGDQISGWKKARGRLEEIERRLAAPEVEDVAKSADGANERLEKGISDRDAARRRLEEAREEHAASVLTASLTVGDPCPVCAQTVDEIPHRPAPAGIEELMDEESRLTTAVDALRSRADEVRTELARAETARSGLAEQRDSLASELGDVPPAEDLDTLEQDLTRLVADLEGAGKELAAREKEEKEARDALEDLADESRAVDRSYREALKDLGALDPPISESDDVVVRWKELIEWRDEALEGLREEMNAAEKTLIAARETAAAGREDLAKNLRERGIEAREPYAVQVATAAQSARALVETQTKTAQEAAALRERVEEASVETAVAETLANHLRADGFERWLMAGALSDLVAGANDLLGKLSSGGYSLHSDESGSFSIVDHRNANEMRSVSTLSGGETFLVSLALALSLAETLAAKGGSGLDAIILDEGFGTLDEESLDLVAAVLEELAGEGLMVGIITHVKELAARAPVRYEVSRESGGASVRVVS